MRELPILFREDLVRKIAAGRKTVTRRPIVPQPSTDFVDGPHVSTALECARGTLSNGFSWGAPARYGVPGDRLWVRETWAAHASWDEVAPSAIPTTAATVAWYRALGEDAPSRLISSSSPEPDPSKERRAPTMRGRWRPSLHLPRAWARLFLRVVDVRVERLQEIAEESAIAEGAPGTRGELNAYGEEILEPARDWVRRSWDKLYPGWRGAAPRLTWAANPWVWVVRFEVER